MIHHIQNVVLSFLLHAANRVAKGYCDSIKTSFYGIKDEILSRKGRQIGYDIQHIKGKRCNSCDGHGRYWKYGRNGKPYDYDDCWHCCGGWYKLPIWVCLKRIQYGKYIFHKPLKRLDSVSNPFSKDELGWDVTTNPIIEGYIEHPEHKFGLYALLILLWIYDRGKFRSLLNQEWYWKTWRIRHWINRHMTWRGWIMIDVPKLRINSYWDDEFKEELPF